MFDITKLSKTYSVRRLGPADVDAVFSLCEENSQYYRYCGAEASKKQILRDMQLLPPGVLPSDKYYLGFFQANVLIAVMDLLDGYPEPNIAFIGFFMMRKALQGQNLGSALIQESASYLKTLGTTTVRLGIDKGNPQSTRFWKKNGFVVIREVSQEEGTILVAEKSLLYPGKR